MTTSTLYVQMDEADRVDFLEFPGIVANIAQTSRYFATVMMQIAGRMGIEDAELSRVAETVRVENERLAQLAGRMGGISSQIEYVEENRHGDEVALIFRNDELEDLAKSVNSADFLLQSAGTAFGLIGQVAGEGMAEGHQIDEICELAKRAFAHAAEHEGQALQRLSTRLNKGKRS